MYSICNCFGEFNSIGDIDIDDSFYTSLTRPGCPNNDLETW